MLLMPSLVSILSILWLWKDTGDRERIAAHMVSTVWALAKAGVRP